MTQFRTMTEKQQELFFVEDNVVFVSCGAGAGRTIAAAFLAMKPGNNILVVGSLSQYKHSGGYEETWKEVLIPMGCIYKQVERMFVKPNGQTIKVVTQSELNKDLECDIAVVDNFNASRKDILDCLKPWQQLYLMATPIEDSHHPAYKFAKALTYDNKQYMTIVDGFPFFARNLASLMDIFGDVYWFEPILIRMTIEDNIHLQQTQPSYKQMLEALPMKQRIPYLTGKWIFED